MRRGWARALAGGALLACCAVIGAEDRPSFLVNGTYTSSFDVENRRTYPQGDGAFSQGWLNVANLRLRSTVTGSLSLYVSASITAPTGFYAEALGADVDAELERLYLKAGTDSLDVEAGLIRVARGYGTVFSPLDFLNPRNVTDTLDPVGRPPGRWGVHASLFPGDLWRVDAFGLAPEDPAEDELLGSLLGAGTTFSNEGVTCDLLGVILLPEAGPHGAAAPPYLSKSPGAVLGFAVKADVEVGLFAEAIYRFEREVFADGGAYKGLEAAVGVDYTIGDLYLLTEYEFFGPGPAGWRSGLDTLYTGSDWEDASPLQRLSLFDPSVRPELFARHDYLFALARLTVAQGLRAGLSCLAGLDDVSGLVTAFAEADVLQGLTVQARFLQPLDRRLLDSGAPAGEWGSTVLGFHQLLGIVARVKF
jgi:hypothetical protein